MKKLIKEILLKLGIKKYQIRFLNLYKNQIINKYIFFNDSLREKKLEKLFKKNHGYNMSLKNNNIETFSQKLYYRRLYPESKLFSKLADKYLVREYVKEKIGEEYLIPVYLVTENLTQEHWQNLPNSFVIKTTHDSGNIEIIKDKSSLNNREVIQIIRKMNLGLKINYGWSNLEKHYIEIKPRIIVEKLLLDEENKVPKDYKFHFFDNSGNNRIFIQIDTDRFIEHKRSIYDENLKEINMKIDTSFEKVNTKIRIENLEILKEITKKLVQGIKYARVDYYEIKGKIYFGEITLTHGGGNEKIEPIEYDKKWGEYWK